MKRIGHTVSTVNLNKVEANLAASFDSVGVCLFQAFEVLDASFDRVRVVACFERDLGRGNNWVQVSPGRFIDRKRLDIHTLARPATVLFRDYRALRMSPLVRQPLIPGRRS